MVADTYKGTGVGSKLINLWEILRGRNMKYYYIGMHNEFDPSNYEKDFTEHISGIELCNFDDISDVDEVYKLSK